MTAEAARILLGVDDDATDVEIAAAHRRLIETVHPDICKGPEAARLARQATNARNFLYIGRALGSTGDETGADDPVLQAMVVRALAKTDGDTTVAKLVAEVFTAMSRAPAPERDAWIRRLGETSFWSEGGKLRLWRIHGDRISPMNAEDRRAGQTPAPAPAQTQPTAAGHPLKTPGAPVERETADTPRTSTPWPGADAAGALASTAAEWLTAVAATALLTLAALMAAAGVAGVNAGNRLDAARYSIFCLIALSTGWSVRKTVDLPWTTFRTLRVLVPGIAGGLAITWILESAFTWLREAMQ